MVAFLLNIFLPYIVPTLGTAIAGLVIRWLHQGALLAKLKTSDAADQAKLDDLEHLLDTAVDQAVHGVGSDVLSQKTPAQIAQDAFVVLKTLATEQSLSDLAAVAKVVGTAVLPYLMARLTGKAATAKALAVPANAAAEFDKLSSAEKRAAVAALGKAA